MELASSGDISLFVTYASAATRSRATSTATVAAKKAFNIDILASCEVSIIETYQERPAGKRIREQASKAAVQSGGIEAKSVALPTHERIGVHHQHTKAQLSTAMPPRKVRSGWFGTIQSTRVVVPMTSPAALSPP
jgi:hypothetical protein